MIPNDSRPEWVRNLGLFSVIVVDLIGYTGAGIALGYLVWKKWNAPWWVLLLTSLAGLGLAMYRVYQLTNASQNTEETPEPKESREPPNTEQR